MGGLFGFKQCPLAPLDSRLFLIACLLLDLLAFTKLVAGGLVSPDLVRAFLADATSALFLLALKGPVRLCHGFHLPAGVAEASGHLAL